MADIKYRPIWSEDGRTLTNVLVKDKYETYNVVTEWYDGTPMVDTKIDSDLVYVKYEGKYLVRNFEYGQVLQKDTMQEMRDTSPYEILLLKMGVYKHIQLNGYYEKGDTPAPIDYKLSNTTEGDDGGSVIEVGGDKLEHKFKGEVDVRYYGVVNGDEIQDKVNLIINKFKKVFIPSGEYIVDVTKPADSLGRKGIVPADGSELRMSKDAVLKAKPNADSRYSLIDLVYTKDVKIIGGELVGDRYTHQGTTGEWGHGVNMWSSENVELEDIKIRDFWGDGVYVGGVDGTSLYGAGTITSEQEAIPSTGVILRNIEIDNCRRQGISLVCGKESVF